TTYSVQRAAASLTGALAGEQRIFTGAMRQAGVCLAATVEEAFDAAATFATQPLPAGPNTVVVTTAGGWGVMTADALTGSSLRLIPLPDDLRAAVDTRLPPRWSRSNPIDMAGGESRDTVPEVLQLVASHPEVDAVIFLGLGIQSNTARLLRDGPFHPDHGLERIVAFHERQDPPFAEAAAVGAGREEAVGAVDELQRRLDPGPQRGHEVHAVVGGAQQVAVLEADHGRLAGDGQRRHRRPEVVLPDHCPAAPAVRRGLQFH